MFDEKPKAWERNVAGAAGFTLAGIVLFCSYIYMQAFENFYQAGVALVGGVAFFMIRRFVMKYCNGPEYDDVKNLFCIVVNSRRIMYMMIIFFFVFINPILYIFLYHIKNEFFPDKESFNEIEVLILSIDIIFSFYFSFFLRDHEAPKG